MRSKKNNFKNRLEKLERFTLILKNLLYGNYDEIGGRTQSKVLLAYFLRLSLILVVSLMGIALTGALLETAIFAGVAGGISSVMVINDGFKMLEEEKEENDFEPEIPEDVFLEDDSKESTLSDGYNKTVSQSLSQIDENQDERKDKPLVQKLTK